MRYETIEILKTEYYRSKPLVNKSYDMVRVTMTCSLNEWRSVTRHLTDGVPQQADTPDAESDAVCPKCGSDLGHYPNWAVALGSGRKRRLKPVKDRE